MSVTTSPTSSSAASTNVFGAVRQIDAGPLNVGYVEEGPADGPAVVLLHGWPYDIHSYVDVAPLLAAAGYRVTVPYLRGFGSTRFLSDETFRNGEQAALALDVIAFMDALEIDSAILAGFDWGARTADIVAALWPERCNGLVSVSGYLIVNLEANRRPLPPKAELGWWYQYYFATERGRLGYSESRRDFNRLIWQLAWPKWDFDDATFDRTAASFENPDHIDIVIHNYRWRLSLAEGEQQYNELEARLFERPAITVPTITIGSDFDGPPRTDTPTPRNSRASIRTECSTASATRSRKRLRKPSPTPCAKWGGWRSVRSDVDATQEVGMSFISRGFRRRGREPDADVTRLPPGQYLTNGFPVLSAGPTPHTPLDRWDFSIVGEIDEPRSWTWEESGRSSARCRARR